MRAGISDGDSHLRSFLSLSLSISLSFFLSTSASLRASIEKKSPQNSTVYVGKKSDDDFYEASPYLRGIKG